MRIKHCLGSAIRRLTGFWKPQIKPSGGAPKTSLRRHAPITVARYRGAGNPPPLHWKACDPSTIMRFKAVLTCPSGHGLTLRTHRIESNGAVRPSVVCQFPGCQFHDFVRLRDWDLGRLGSIEDQLYSSDN